VKAMGEDRVRWTGPAVIWRTWSREIRPLRLLTIALTLDGSVFSLTLKRTTCSMTDWDGEDADILAASLKENEGLRTGRCLGCEKMRGNGGEKSVRAFRDSIVCIRYPQGSI
jgi:hypothetical protein